MDADLSIAIVQHTSDAVIFADLGGVIRVWNASAEAIFGFTAAEAIGRSLDLIIPERLREAHWKAFDQALESGRTRLGRRSFITRSLHQSDRKLYVDMSFAVVRDAAGAVVGAVAIARDATERYQSEQATRKRLVELEARIGPAPGSTP
jgi:PAS domain S-box-containing protein